MKYKIAVFPGDGVGPELINEGMKVIEKAAELDNFEIEWIKYPYGAEHYIEMLETQSISEHAQKSETCERVRFAHSHAKVFDIKELLPEKILKEIKNSCNAVYCGTFENLKIEAGAGKSISSAIKNYFDQFASIRPIKLLPTVECPLNNKTHDEINFIIIRENIEDFYIGANGRAKNGKSKHQLELNKSTFKVKFGLDIETKGGEIAYQIGVLSKKGCERVIKYAFEYAKSKNKKKIVAIDKANMLDSYNFWREGVNKIAKEYPNIEYEFELIDAAVMNFIRQPEKYQVIVAPNMFGDILSDLGSMVQGGLAFSARGNINPDEISMFEPAHGSAPQLKGKGIVNPIATIWAGALMLDNIGQQKSSDLVIKAIEAVLKDGRTRTHDLGGNNSTSEMGDAIVDKFIEIHD